MKTILKLRVVLATTIAIELLISHVRAEVVAPKAPPHHLDVAVPTCGPDLEPCGEEKVSCNVKGIYWEVINPWWMDDQMILETLCSENHTATSLQEDKLNKIFFKRETQPRIPAIVQKVVTMDSIMFRTQAEGDNTKFKARVLETAVPAKTGQFAFTSPTLYVAVTISAGNPDNSNDFTIIPIIPTPTKNLNTPYQQPDIGKRKLVATTDFPINTLLPIGDSWVPRTLSEESLLQCMDQGSITGSENTWSSKIQRVFGTFLSTTYDEDDRETLYQLGVVIEQATKDSNPDDPIPSHDMSLSQKLFSRVVRLASKTPAGEAKRFLETCSHAIVDTICYNSEDARKIEMVTKMESWYQKNQCLSPRTAYKDVDPKNPINENLQFGLHIASQMGALGFDGRGFSGKELDPTTLWTLNHIPWMVTHRSLATCPRGEPQQMHKTTTDFVLPVCSCSPSWMTSDGRNTNFSTTEIHLSCAVTYFRWDYYNVDTKDIQQAIQRHISDLSDCDHEINGITDLLPPWIAQIPRTLERVSVDEMEIFSGPILDFQAQDAQSTNDISPVPEGQGVGYSSSSSFQSQGHRGMRNPAATAHPVSSMASPPSLVIPESPSAASAIKFGDQDGSQPLPKRVQMAVIQGGTTVEDNSKTGTPGARTIKHGASSTVFTAATATFEGHAYTFSGDGKVIVDGTSTIALSKSQSLPSSTPKPQVYPGAAALLQSATLYFLISVLVVFIC